MPEWDKSGKLGTIPVLPGNNVLVRDNWVHITSYRYLVAAGYRMLEL